MQLAVHPACFWCECTRLNPNHPEQAGAGNCVPGPGNCRDMVFLNFYFDLFATPPSLFMLLCSRLCRDYFPILRDPSRSSLTSRDASRFSRYFLPMPPCSFIIFPMRTTIILLVHSTLVVILLSPLMSSLPFLLYVLFSGHTEGASTRRIRLARF